MYFEKTCRFETCEWVFHRESFSGITRIFSGYLLVENPATFNSPLATIFIRFLFQLFPILKDLAMVYFYPAFYYFRGWVRGSCLIKDLIPQLHFNWVPFLYRSFVLIAACFHPSVKTHFLVTLPFARRME